FRLWLTGQLESAERYLELLGSELFTPAGMFPELAFYDCHSCHHPIDDLRWSRERAGAGVEPGRRRLADQDLRVLALPARALGSAGAAELEQGTQALVLAGQQDAARLRQAADRLLSQVRARQVDWSSQTFTAAQAAAVRRGLLSAAARGRMAD